MKEKILVGFSGGVDSAVSAYLLKEQGYDVTGCFMRNWDALANNDYLGNPTINDSQCPQEKDYDDAVLAAKIIGIPLLRVDFIKEYWDNVFSYFLSEYQKGRTPNPDIFCNKYIKFDSFLNFAKEHGFDKIAMGHYAKKINIDGKDYLCKCLDNTKDQTYFLSQLSAKQIESCLFPLGDITKKEVREIANKLNLNIANKKDSTGVCFIGERNFKQFLSNYLPSKKGDIVDIETNKKIGTHSGTLYYTIGQRHGLGIGGIKNEEAKGWFVVKKDVKNNILYVASGNDNDYLTSNRCIIKSINVLKDFKDNTKAYAKFRYRQADNEVFMSYIDKDTIELRYPQGVKSVTTGQAAVIYDENGILIVGGIIDQVYKDDKRIDI